MLNTRRHRGQKLDKDDQVLIHPNRDLILLLRILLLLQNLPLVPACAASGRDTARIPLPVAAAALLHQLRCLHVVNEAFHAATDIPLLVLGEGSAFLLLLLPEPAEPQLERRVGTVEQDFHDGGVAAGMHRGHLDAGVEEGEVLEGDGLVGVVAHDVFHHLRWGQGRRGGEVAGEVEPRGAVIGGVGYVEGVGACRAGEVGSMLVFGCLRICKGR